MDFGKILVDGGIISILISFILIGMLWYNPRMFLNKGDYPPDVIAAVPPKTDEERRMGIILGIPFFIVALGVPLYSRHYKLSNGVFRWTSSLKSSPIAKPKYH